MNKYQGWLRAKIEIGEQVLELAFDVSNTVHKFKSSSVYVSSLRLVSNGFTILSLNNAY